MQNNVRIGDSTETKKYSKMALVSSMLMMVTWTGSGWNSLSTYAVFVVEDFGCTTAQYMTLFTILSLTNCIISFTCYGLIMQKVGVRKILFIGGLLASAGFAIWAVSPSIQVMWLGGVVFTLGLAFLNINTLNVMVTTWFKKGTAKYTGVAQCFGPASGAFFNTIWGIVMVMIGWRIPFWISAAFSLIMTFIIYRLYQDPKEVGCAANGEEEMKAKLAEVTAEKEVTLETGPTFAECMRRPRTYVLVVAYALAGICDYGLLGNFALIGAHYGYGDYAGFIMGFSWLAQIVSFLLLGAIIDKWGSKIAMIFCFILVILVGCVFLMDEVPLSLIFICGACLGFADGAVQLPMGASAREALGTRDFAKKMGIVGGGCYLGVSFATVIVAAIFDATGSYKPSMIFIIILSVFTAILFMFATKPIFKDENKDIRK